MGRSKLAAVSNHDQHSRQLLIVPLLCRMADAAGSKWESNTWPELARLAKDVPEAGIHFQSKYA